MPIAYGLRCVQEEGDADGLLLGWCRSTEPLVTLNESLLSLRLAELGAGHYVGVVSDAHAFAARAALQRLAHLTGRPEVLRLGQLVPDMHWGNTAA
jgi:hypothetical protein